ncbi:MAG: sigma-54 dependent transcriptional regulator [Desulfobacterales bacterium]|nr:sigma-54 dependent transcriptional regulator [Desulfobacterales bacterium]
MSILEQAVILVIDDDELFRESMESLISRMGHRFYGTGSIEEATSLLTERPVDLILLDLFLPDGKGVDHIDLFRSSASSPELVVITGQGDPESASTSIKKGALEFLVKPCSINETRQAIVRALTHRSAQKLYQPPPLHRSDIIGESQALAASFDAMARAAAGDSSILITGETGTGKELFARTIHANSSRKGNPFITVDCASLTETLVESTLFGHGKGAFTSADKEHAGLVKAADKGTLFLDEIGEMPLSLQKTFLRVLQEKRFRPVGKTTEVTSDFRLIAATNRNLPQMVEEGRFRRDLLFRLRTLTVELPPLRKRCDDIPLLAQHHTQRLAALYGLPDKRFEPGFFDMLKRCPWPGNVRELFNVVEHAFFASAERPAVHVMDLPQEIRIEVAKLSVEEGAPRQAPESPPSEPNPSFFSKGEPSIKEVRNRVESTYLKQLIRHTQGCVLRMLRISGLSRSHLYAMLKRYDLTHRLKK